jgi:hypothetical protein
MNSLGDGSTAAALFVLAVPASSPSGGESSSSALLSPRRPLPLPCCRDVTTVVGATSGLEAPDSWLWTGCRKSSGADVALRCCSKILLNPPPPPPPDAFAEVGVMLPPTLFLAPTMTVPDFFFFRLRAAVPDP